MHTVYIDKYPEKFINNSSNLCDFSFSTVNILYSGITYPSPKFIHKNDYITHYTFEYIVSGKGYTYIDEKEYVLTEGTLAITAPNQIISFNSDPKNPYKRMFVCPYGYFMDVICNFYKITPPIFIKKSRRKKRNGADYQQHGKSHIHRNALE